MRLVLIRAVTNFAIGSRNSASKTGRKNGSNRRSKCTSAVDASAIQFKNAEPVLARGMGRSGFELKAVDDITELRQKMYFSASCKLPRVVRSFR